jgi:hypothetical protein
MKSFISLRTQYENLGDEVINALLVRQLSARMPVVALTSGVPDWYVELFRTHLPAGAAVSFEPSSAQFYLRLAAAGLTERSYLFLSPGDTTSRSTRFTPRDRMMQALVALPQLRLANVGASFSSLGVPRAHIFAASLRRGAPLTIRDLRSRAKAASEGVTLPVVPDLAYLLGRETSDQGDKALISLRQVNSTSYSQDILVRVIDLVRRAGLEPVVSWQVGRDRDYCEGLARSLGIRFIDFGADRPTLTQMAELYRQCRLVVSNRLHVLLIAAAYGAAAFPLVDREETKVRGIFETAGLDDLIIDTDAGLDEVSPLMVDYRGLDGRFAAAFDSANTELQTYFDALVATGRSR